MYRFTLLVLTMILILSACGEDKGRGSAEFIASENEWRAERDQRMKAETSWLTIAGLYWLEEGTNTFGTGTENDIVLPAGSAPGQIGAFILEEGIVRLVADLDTGIYLNEKPVQMADLTTDADGKPDVLTINDLRMWVISRGPRLGIRLRDLNAANFINYTGLAFFPPDEKYRVSATLEPFEEPEKAYVPTVIGTDEEYSVPGLLRFELEGKQLALKPFSTSDSTKLFIIFRDGTSGFETYGAGRFMYVDIIGDNKVDLNFNRAYCPPCAYTDFATCPLPPPENNLGIRIEAGEKNYPGTTH